jgi:Icc-related predicted phosphoesterase
MASAAQCLTVKILAVCDQVVERLYDLIPQGHFRDVSLLVGCGDLPYDYLEHMVSALNVDLLYVPGNHDPAHDPRSNATRVQGGMNLDLRTHRFRGLLLAGFGGSVRYRPDGPNQYTQTDAFVRAAMLVPGLLLNRWRYRKPLDVLITHSPPYGINDDESAAHRGLKAINWLLSWTRPRFHLHGHMHSLRRNLTPDINHLGPTSIINVFPYRVIELPDAT